MRFVLFDRLLEFKKGQGARIIKNVSQSEDFFIDHFPGYPVVPGSIILGAFEQGGEILLAASHDFTARPVLQRVARASFRHFVVPGDQIEIQLLLDAKTGRHVHARAAVAGKRVADARLEFALEKAEGDPALEEACARLKELYGILTSSPLAKVWDLWTGSE